MKEILKRFGIGRSTLYEILKSGRLKSCVVKTHKWNVKGSRLVYLPSVREYFEKLAAEQSVKDGLSDE